jgi:hypothetical protein
MANTTTGRERAVTGKVRPGRGKTQASLELIQAAHDIAERNHPLTIRGICYKLFVRGLIPDMSTKSTRRVSEQLTDARQPSRNICNWAEDWHWIVDETREAERQAQWDDPQSIIQQAVRQYRRNNWREQPVDIEVWSEKGTVRGVAAPVLEEYGVTFRVMHGFGSYTSVRQIVEERRYADKPLIALYIGDKDPSGSFMSEVDLPARLAEYGAEDIELIRVALVDSDCTDALPSFSASEKSKDARYPWFTTHHGHRCWELDAMDEVELRQRLEDTITGEMDMDAWEHSRKIERVEVASMREYVAATRAVARHYRRTGRGAP